VITFAIWAIMAVMVWASYRLRGRIHYGYFIGGLLFGIYNEVCFEFCWNYTSAMWPFLYKDVSLAIITGWGVMALFAASLSDYCVSRLWLRKPELVRLVLDTLVFAVFGITQEFSMRKSAYWTYNFDVHANWAIQIIGYCVPALLMLSLGRRIQDILERN
jgi:hypothetical protein